MVHKVYDAKGLHCPLPVMQAKKELKAMNPGDSLEVLSTDPGSVRDFHTFRRSTDYELQKSTSDGDTYRFIIRK